VFGYLRSISVFYHICDEANNPLTYFEKRETRSGDSEKTFDNLMTLSGCDFISKTQ
jgi:hypothetical protein